MWKLASLVGGILVIVGSFLTWVSVDVGFATFSSTGFENIEGKLTAAAGAVLVVLALLILRDIGPGRVMGILVLAAAGFAAVVLLLEYLDVLERIREAGSSADATIGIGVWITALGAIDALIGGVMLSRSSE